MSIMTAMPQGAAVEGINPNLLDNWYFVGGGSQQGSGQFPINQRGATSGQTTNNSYGLDRWKWSYGSSIGTWSLVNAGLTLTPVDSVQMIQPCRSLTEFPQRRLTASVLFSDGTFYSGSETLDANGTAQYWSGNNVILRSINYDFRVIVYETKTIVAVKLELGDQQTLAQNLGTTSSPNWVLNETPDYGIEVLKCETSITDSADPESNLKVVTNKATFIHSSLDLNNYKQPGVYYWTNAPTNAPVTSGIGSWLNGWLYVYKSDDGSRVVQEALYNPGSTEEVSPMVRMYGSNGWGPWRTIDRSLNANLTLHVNATSGDDNNDGLTAATALKTINAAFAKIPADMAGRRAIVQLAEGTYASATLGTRQGGTYQISNDTGAAQANIKIQGLSISDSCAMISVLLSNVTFYGANVTTNYHARGGFLCVTNCTFDNARLVNQGGQCYVNSCTFRNISSSAIYGWQSDLFITSATIESTVTTGVVTQGGVVTVETITNNATSQYSTSQGGRIFVGGRTYKESPSKVTLFQTQTSLGTGTTDITISDDYRKYTFLEFMFSKASSSTRAILYIHSNSIAVSAWYPIAPGGTVVTLRISNISGTYTQVRISNLSITGYYLEAINAIP